MNNSAVSFSLFPPPSPPQQQRGDRLVPLHPAPSVSTLGHLGLVKGQRDGYRSELKLHESAAVQTKQHVSALRKLAFRLAVNISLKETKIAQSARTLAQSRNNSYIHSRKHESRIAELQKTLALHEQRNKDLLKNLEQAAQLTIHAKANRLSQFGPSLPTPTGRPLSPPLSPPPSPPRRISSITPQTHARRPSQDVIADLVEVRTANEHLIKAKKESDHALLLCRTRITALQEDCQQSEDNFRALSKDKTSLQDLLEEYKARVEGLEAEKTRLEGELKITQEKLAASTKSEGSLLAELKVHKERIAALENECQQSRGRISELEESWSSVEEDLSECKQELKSLEKERIALQVELQSARKDLAISERSQSQLQSSIASKEATITELRKELETSQTNVDALNKTITHFEDATRELSSIISDAGGSMAILEKQLDAAVATKTAMEKDIRDVTKSKETIEESLKSAIEAKTSQNWEFQEMENSKNRMQQELQRTRSKLEQSTNSEKSLKEQIQGLVKSRRELQDQLREALRTLDEEERKNPQAAQELEKLRTSRNDLEYSLRELKHQTGDLRDELRTTQSQLASAEKSKADLMASFEASRGDIRKLRLSRARAESNLSTALKSRASLEASAIANRTRILVAETNEVNLQAKLSAAEDEVELLRRTVQDAKHSEVKLEARIAVAEEELEAVKSANAHLESFLGDAAAGMGESNAKLDAAEKSKAQYQKKLSATEEQIRQLQETNTSLFSEIEQKDHDIKELRTQGSTLSAEIRSKDKWINDLQRTNSNFAEGVEAVEYELRILRDTKAAFEYVVRTLKDKVPDLEILDEWCLPPGPEKPLPSRPRLGRKSTSESVERPPTAASYRSNDEELETWAHEVERVRMLREETVFQLKDLHKSEAALRRNLKASEAELQRLGHHSAQATPPPPKRSFVQKAFRIFQWSPSHKSKSWAERRRPNLAPRAYTEPPLPAIPPPSPQPASATSLQDTNNAVDDGVGVWDMETRTWTTPGGVASRSQQHTPARTPLPSSPTGSQRSQRSGRPSFGSRDSQSPNHSLGKPPGTSPGPTDRKNSHAFHFGFRPATARSASVTSGMTGLSSGNNSTGVPAVPPVPPVHHVSGPGSFDAEKKTWGSRFKKGMGL
ncbi:uncharacterized protein K452DRAFT_318985 [Aplosporella prunicola CBS 121167]|uniref:Uncharacterized protein n=1 Tax=Aplosporella prunicola CBS 121167 TaxID=1176127 RepID=A0A6A6BCL8_9PEZI|nr:uncharacterized protein K452DRAFT_318985 [Aplosporella prunicola CBS 121167]KAF2141348.1 hypothetical protein K452DRAFT_318985 [Aplosporella prunicola CBS 121167]